MNDIILTWGAFSVSLFHSDDFIVEKIENLTWGNSDLATTVNPYFAGDNLQNKRPMARDITITLKPTEDKGDYSDLLHKLGRLFNKEVTLTWKNRVIPSLVDNYPDLTTDLVISGVVNEFECPRFEKDVRITLNVHCSNPYWTSLASLTANILTPEVGTTPFVTYSDVDCEMEFDVPNLDFAMGVEWLEITFNKDNADWAIIYIQLANSAETINNAYNHFIFNKGKIKVLSGETAQTAVDVTSMFNWEFVSATDYNVLLGLPVMPAAASEVTVIAVRHRGINTARKAMTFYWNPQFI